MALGERHPRPAVGHEGQQHHASHASTRLCSIWRSSIGEAPCSTLVSQTPIPGARPITGRRHSREIPRAASTFPAAAPAPRVPLRQDSIRIAIAAPMMQRKPAAFDDLERIRHQERGIDRGEQRDDRHRDAGRPLPSRDRDAVEQDRGDQHGARHRDAIGRRQAVRRSEQHHDQQRADHQQPVGGRDIDLAGLLGSRSARSWRAGTSPSASPAGSARTRRRSAPARR